MIRRLLWGLRWGLPWNRHLRENGALVHFTPRPPGHDMPGETPRQFRERLRWHLMTSSGFLRRERLP